MKIKLLENTKIGGRPYKMGAQLEVDRSTGKKLIGRKIAMAKDFVTLTEIQAEKVSEKKAEEIIEELPINAKKRIELIKNLVNIPILEYLINDIRITVRNAAIKRLEQLNY